MRLRVLVPILLLTAASCDNAPPPAPVAPLPVPEAASPALNTASDSPASAPASAKESTPPSEFAMPLPREEAADGWIALFDGHSLFGWTSNEPGVNWRVEEGAIVADEGPIGLLNTTVPFADYELVCEFRMSPGGNSGIFLRTLAKPEDVTRDCYEVNIADSHPEGFLTGSIVGRAKPETGIIGSGDWQTLRMTAQGTRFEVEHNGQRVLEWTDDAPTARLSGFIGLQKNAGRIEFRKALLKPLSLQPLFNGADLSGWREVPGSKSEFRVSDGAIELRDGPGYLETEDVFADFVFQAQARTNAPELNSGYFFRALPGTEEAPANGYEVQIHNGFHDGDRTRPNNAGTGAIFRRIEARRVVPSDGEWFTTTLLANGPRFAVWVDGYQVVDWEDERRPHENPRQGQRLQAGHISLQGHDPTTDLTFRNLSVVELPAH